MTQVQHMLAPDPPRSLVSCSADIRRLVAFALVLPVALFSITYGGSQGAGRVHYQLDDSFGIPIWMALNAVDSVGMTGRRAVFVYVESSLFTGDNIKKICSGLGSRYQNPTWLQVTMHSNKEMLEKSISLFKQPVMTTDLTQEAIERRRDEIIKSIETRFPAGRGYFRASYFRSQFGEVVLTYSPDPDKEEMVRLDLPTSK